MVERLLDRVPVADTYEAFLEAAYASGLSDGFPLAVPDDELISAALASVALDADHVVGTGRRPVTVADVAAATVLAGGRAEYLPTVLAAAIGFFDTLAEREAEVGGLADAAQCVIVSGPERERIGVHNGIGAFGPGWRANASIGRALQLLIKWGCEPPLGAFGDPTQYTFCFGEDTSDSPWVPFGVEQGLSGDASAATVHSVVKASKNFDRGNTGIEEHLNELVLFLRDAAGGTGWFPGQHTSIVVVVGPEWHRQYAAQGWSKQDIRTYLFPRLIDPADPVGTPVALRSASDLYVLRAGGPAEATEWCLIGRASRPVTINIDLLRKG
jgi:hypothetical protein